jgi:hypothetical protein
VPERLKCISVSEFRAIRSFVLNLSGRVQVTSELRIRAAAAAAEAGSR